MSVPRYSNVPGKHGSYAMASETTQERFDNSLDAQEVPGNSYESLDDRQNNVHIYDVAKVEYATPSDAGVRTAEMEKRPTGGKKFTKQQPSKGGNPSTPSKPEVRLSRRTTIVLVIGTLLICTVISLIIALIFYQVASSKIEDNGRKAVQNQNNNVNTGESNSPTALLSEMAALKKNLTSLSDVMNNKIEEIWDLQSEARDMIVLMDRRLDQLENAIHKHTTNHSGANEQSDVCQTGWVFFDNKCYFFSEMKFTYTESVGYCQDKSSELVSVKGPTDNIFVKSLLSRMKAENHWLGMTDSKVEGHWAWSNGVPVTFTDWYRGNEPNGGEAANCAVFWKDVQYQWADDPCTAKYSPICQKRLLHV